MGAFTIIVCGEAFVKVAIGVSGSSVDEVDVIALFFEFVLTFAIWTSYFEDVPNAGIRAGWLRVAWSASLLQLAIAGTAIGVAKLVKVDPLDHLPSEDILEITATLATVYLALGLIGACTRRRPAREADRAPPRHVGRRRGRRDRRVADRLRRPRRGRRRVERGGGALRGGVVPAHSEHRRGRSAVARRFTPSGGGRRPARRARRPRRALPRLP